MKKPNIFIGMPCYDKKIYVDTAISITNTVVELLQNKIISSIFTLAGCAVVTHARNAIVGEFLSKKDKTHLLFIDADMEWSPHTVLRLLKADVPFAAAPYVAKRYQNLPTNLHRPKDLDMFHAVSTKWNVEFEDPNILSGHSKLSDVRHGFARVSRIGAGLMLLRRDMIEKMVEKYADTEYKWDSRADNYVSPHVRYFGLFDLMKESDGTFIGEDYSFCDRWVKGCGGEIWCDVDARITHHGHHRYTGALQESLRLQNRSAQNSPASGEPSDSER